MSTCKVDVSSWEPKQFEIQYFFPLTEQIPLELDFKPCTDYAEEQRKKQNYTGYTLNTWAANGTTSWTTISNNLGAPSFTINVDAMPITIISKKKPNFIMKFIYKSMGMKWKAE
jgi:hypothetical protein